MRQYSRAINFYKQTLEIDRKIGDRRSEAIALENLGRAYNLLGQFQLAIDFYQQGLEIVRRIDDRKSEATFLFKIANVFAKLGQGWNAVQHYQQAKQIYQSLELEHNAEVCATAIYQLNQTHRNIILPAQQPIRAPRLDN